MSCVQQACAPVSRASQACDSGDVYWYNSCGLREDLVDDCGARDCVVDRCAPVQATDAGFSPAAATYVRAAIAALDGSLVVVDAAGLQTTMREYVAGSWRDIATPASVSAPYTVVATAANDVSLFAGATRELHRWDGASWSTMPALPQFVVTHSSPLYNESSQEAEEVALTYVGGSPVVVTTIIGRYSIDSSSARGFTYDIEAHWWSGSSWTLVDRVHEEGDLESFPDVVAPQPPLTLVERNEAVIVFATDARRTKARLWRLDSSTMEPFVAGPGAGLTRIGGTIAEAFDSDLIALTTEGTGLLFERGAPVSAAADWTSLLQRPGSSVSYVGLARRADAETVAAWVEGTTLRVGRVAGPEMIPLEGIPEIAASEVAPGTARLVSRAGITCVTWIASAPTPPSTRLLCEAE